MGKEGWNTVYFTLDYFPPTGVGGLEYARLSVPTGKVRYEDGQVFIEVRNPGEWHELRQFIQPDDPHLNQAINEALHGRGRL